MINYSAMLCSSEKCSADCSTYVFQVPNNVPREKGSSGEATKSWILTFIFSLNTVYTEILTLFFVLFSLVQQPPSVSRTCAKPRATLQM